MARSYDPAKKALKLERNKNRKASGKYLQLIEMVTESPQFKLLSSNAFKVLVLLLARYNGENNGDINIARKEMADIGFGRNGVAFGQAVDELVEKCFVIITRPGSYASGCTLYAVTTEPMDACKRKFEKKHDYPSEHAASHAWKKIPCTTPVQGQALHQCNVRRKFDQSCTTPVLVGVSSSAPPCTTPVLLCTGTNLNKGLHASAPAAAPDAALTLIQGSKGNWPKSNQRNAAGRFPANT